MSVSRLSTQHLPRLNLLDLIGVVPEAHLLDARPLIRAAVTAALKDAGHPPESLTFGEITYDDDDEDGFWSDVNVFYPQAALVSV
ncbi:hypothetical protein ASD11_15055 [Aeromicrobium sp. Root495]|uniref:hypothetical protein n=1 Tax=Aeromicrobium sp. Root495 TaxID=1736550 RepID=UPI0006FE80D6|nr:hypothetical protein [Aeromicrobium sp. Root495]KQY55820.1 hypothetical protein ASD11_15055 [Aeromicrobium sp. Root495]